jgi:hypothetical protein
MNLSLFVLSCLLVTPVSLSSMLLLRFRNEETRIRDASLLRVSSVLAARSSVACLAAPVQLASPLVAQSATHGDSTGLHCDHYD